jgi:hypothetical protein
MMAPTMRGDGRMASNDKTDKVRVKLAAYITMIKFYPME